MTRHASSEKRCRNSYARENLVLRSPNTCGQFDKEPERCLRSRVGLTPCSYVSSADGKMSCRRNMSYYRSSLSVFDCITDVRFGRHVHPGHELPVVADVRACVAHCLSHPNCSTVSVSTSRHSCFWFSPRLACVSMASPTQVLLPLLLLLSLLLADASGRRASALVQPGYDAFMARELATPGAVRPVYSRTQPFFTSISYCACLRAARLKLTPSLSLYYLSRFSFPPAPPSPTRIGCEVPRGCMDRRWRFAERRAGAHALCAQDCGLHQRKRVP